MKKLTLAAALLCAGAVTFAQTPAVTPPSTAPVTPPKREAGFKPGEVAPPLSVGEWVKGAPIPQLEKGKVYLVEFWATWCGPCIGNIPHLNTMEKKYGKDGLVVIGFSNPDAAPGETRKENNTLDMVREFVAGRGDRMDYHVAYDTPDKATYKSWMNTIGGIPHAFLIDREGRLAVDFHPYYMDDAIQQVLAGTWSYEEGYKKLRRSSDLYGDALNANYDEFKTVYATLEKEFPFLAHRMLEVKFGKTRLARDEQEFMATARDMIAAAREEGNPADISAIVRSQLRPRPAPRPEPVLTPEQQKQQEVQAAARAKAQEQYMATLTPKQRQRMLEAPAREKQRLEEEKTALKLPLDVLAEMADTACEVSKNSDPTALSAKAEVAFARGDRKAAVEFQTKAVAAATGPAKTYEEKRLAEFQAGATTGA
jgi:thiol-disulfide isomerase/thioredoxin